MHFLMENARRVVIKVGTGILTTADGAMHVERVKSICRQVQVLRDRGIQVIIVSSGSIGLGMHQLGHNKRPVDLTEQQACAAIGQSILIDTWQRGFDPYDTIVAQLLFTHEDVRARKRHVAMLNLFERLLAAGIVPIVNENDSVSADEIKFGDNDVLSALVASLTKADLLVILTTMPGLMDFKGSGEVVPVVERITPEIERLAGGTLSTTSVGGMVTKIEAAKVATGSGSGVFIGSGEVEDILPRILRGEAEGTFFVPGDTTLVSRKRWLAFFERPVGTVRIDEGACKALLNDGRSLLPKGVTGHTGKFDSGAVVVIEKPDGTPLARGISQFGSTDLASFAGRDTDEIRALVPGRRRFEVVHRDSMVMLG